MQKLVVLFILVSSVAFNAQAAVSEQRRVRSLPTSVTAVPTAVSTSARAATARSVAPVIKSTSVPTTSARAATSTRTIVGRSATPVASNVTARAAVSQKVIGTGTKVAGATQNIIVNEQCRLKFEGCMDSFCMIDNTSGGRCICSDRQSELNGVLAEIEKLDTQSYKMATEGVEKIEMGADAIQAIANANAAADQILNGTDKSNTSPRRKPLDLTLWDQVEFDEVDEDIFATTNTLQDGIDGKEGDNLRLAASQICVAQMPECSADISMLQMMYNQRVKSDCTAYENELKKQKTASANKLASAEKALREAALESLRAANKYDLGQCTVQFKQCMATTAGCKDDFTGCVGIAAAENAQKSSKVKSSMKMVDITGAYSKISVAASTLDALESKKPMCTNITNSCVAVRDQVWNTFLREVAPQLKTAELLAESDLRTSCIGNISACFQKACKDTMDPNDPDGSYDMCLSRPETVSSLCRIQIEPCVAAEPLIMDFVNARLASMRVDSCTTAVKSCLQSDDRCGSDYTKCVGLDTDTIVRMCPYDKLTGCQKVYTDSSKDIRGDAVYDELANMVQGIMLNIDNNMLTQCQNVANEAMIKVCGGTENCDGLTVDENVGARSLEYKICEYSNSNNNMSIDFAKCRMDLAQITDNELRSNILISGVLDGAIYWDSVGFNEEGRLSTVEDYLKKIDVTGMTELQTDKVRSELATLQSNIDAAINAIEADPTVQYCMTGRQVQGMKDMKIGRTGAARFPGLTKQMRLQIATSALKNAKDNYFAKYDELSKKMLKDYTLLGERVAGIVEVDAKNVRRDSGRMACINLSDVAILPQSPTPQKGVFGKIFVSLLTGGVALPFAIADTIQKNPKYTTSDFSALELVGSKQMNQWNYKEVITSTYTWDTLNCHKCIRSQTCGKTKNPLFGSKYCKDWNDEVEKCDDIQF